MDSLIRAAQALSEGDPLGALKRVALRDDPPALALRGIAMAQLGEFARAKELLRKAIRLFSGRDPVARARCIVAEAEIALASRELTWPENKLRTARDTLEKHGDKVNAAHAHYLDIRRLVLVGRVEEAEHALADFDPRLLPPALRTSHELVVAGIAMRRIRAKAARKALVRAEAAARHARIPALSAEVESAARILRTPAARMVARGVERPLLLEEVEKLMASKTLIVDACRNVLRESGIVVSLVTRPVLFALARALGEAWPGDVSRDLLLARAFGARFVDESHRMRLRVEIGRLRKMLRPMADISATKFGFKLEPRRADNVMVLAQPVEDENGGVLAFLADGESWSSSALAIALGRSNRTIERALDALAATGKVQSFGKARARLWIASPVPGITTALLLPAPLPVE